MHTLRSIIFITGMFLLAFGFIMVIPMIASQCMGYEWKNFCTGAGVTCVLGMVFILLGKLHRFHGISAIFATTSCIWAILPLFAAIPFYLDNLSYVDALFEAVSGITTTGATVFSNIENQSAGILLWRAILHSIGGIGIVTTGIAVFPRLGILSINGLLYSEYSEAIKKRLARTRNVVIYIVIIYYSLILLCAFFYYLAGMSVFDAMCYGMSTASTGGFANHNTSLGYYNDPILEMIAIIFMILGSIPFLSYLKVIKRFRVCYDEQVSYFVRTVIVSALLACFWLCKNVEMGIPLLFRYGIFTTVSLITSTGFSICDYIRWDCISVLAFFLAFIGGCGGSASGGIKIFRIIVLLRSIKSYFYFLFDPNDNYTIKFNGKALESSEVNSVFIFFTMYIFTFAIASVIVSYLSNSDGVTSISTASAMLTNSGSGLSNLVGPVGNYSHFSNTVKLFLSFLMLLGRLELLPIYFSMFNMTKVKNYCN